MRYIYKHGEMCHVAQNVLNISRNTFLYEMYYKKCAKSTNTCQSVPLNECTWTSPSFLNCVNCIKFVKNAPICVKYTRIHEMIKIVPRLIKVEEMYKNATTKTLLLKKYQNEPKYKKITQKRKKIIKLHKIYLMDWKEPKHAHYS